MAAKATVQLGDEAIDIYGNDQDPEFKNIAAHASTMRPLLVFLRNHVTEGLIFDVGANIGLTSIAISTVLPNCRVIAFEPSPVNISFFIRNTEKRHNVELVQAGVGSIGGAMNFVISPVGVNSHVATPEYLYANHPDFHPPTVPIVTLDEFVERRNIRERVTLIKTDTEGFEPHVLAGAARAIERDAPYIWMEFNSICLNVAHGFSPMAFARALFDRFEVYRFSNFALTPVRNAEVLVHDNMIVHGSVEDIVLRPRIGKRMPTVEEMTLPASVVMELENLRRRCDRTKQS